jgi:methionine synthase II (cobalamin-independent)
MKQESGRLSTVEAAEGAQVSADGDTSRKCKARMKIAIGVINHHSLQVEPPEEVAAHIRLALEYIPLERLVLSSDAGWAAKAWPAGTPSISRRARAGHQHRATRVPHTGR